MFLMWFSADDATMASVDAFHAGLAARALRRGAERSFRGDFFKVSGNVFM
jgi:hypothetical protein